MNYEQRWREAYGPMYAAQGKRCAPAPPLRWKLVYIGKYVAVWECLVCGRDVATIVTGDGNVDQAPAECAQCAGRVGASA